VVDLRGGCVIRYSVVEYFGGFSLFGVGVISMPWFLHNLHNGMTVWVLLLVKKCDSQWGRVWDWGDKSSWRCCRFGSVDCVVAVD